MPDAPLGGYSCNLSSWGVSSNQYVTMLSRMNFKSANLVVTGENYNVSAPLATIASHVAGLRSWVVDMEFEAYTAPRIGNAGLVTWSAGGYAKFIEGFVFTLEYPIHDVTSLRETVGGTIPTWRTYMPDLGVWSGSYAAKLSDTTAPIVPSVANTGTGQTGAASPPTITLVYGDSATDESFSGSIITESTAYIIGRGQVAMANIGFRGIGNPTSAGTAPVWPGGSIGLPTWTDGAASPVGPITLASKNGARTFVGEDGFITRFSLACAVGQPVTVSIRYQGCGTLTTN